MGTFLTDIVHIQQNSYEVTIDPTFQNIRYNGKAYNTIDEAIAALDPDGTAEENVITLFSVEYDVPATMPSDVNMTFVGDADNVIFNVKNSTYIKADNVKFKNVTLRFGENAQIRTKNTIEYEDCDLEGTVSVRTPTASFKNCDFSDASTWALVELTMGGEWNMNATFEDCDFNANTTYGIRIGYNTQQPDNRFMNVKVTVNNCNFVKETDEDSDYAISIFAPWFGRQSTLTINKTTYKGFSDLWNESKWDGSCYSFNVIVDGETEQSHVCHYDDANGGHVL